MNLNGGGMCWSRTELLVVVKATVYQNTRKKLSHLVRQYMSHSSLCVNNNSVFFFYVFVNDEMAILKKSTIKI